MSTKNKIVIDLQGQDILEQIVPFQLDTKKLSTSRLETLITSDADDKSSKSAFNQNKLVFSEDQSQDMTQKVSNTLPDQSKNQQEIDQFKDILQANYLIDKKANISNPKDKRQSEFQHLKLEQSLERSEQQKLGHKKLVLDCPKVRDQSIQEFIQSRQNIQKTKTQFPLTNYDSLFNSKTTTTAPNINNSANNPTAPPIGDQDVNIDEFENFFLFQKNKKIKTDEGANQIEGQETDNYNRNLDSIFDYIENQKKIVEPSKIIFDNTSIEPQKSVNTRDYLFDDPKQINFSDESNINTVSGLSDTSNGKSPLKKVKRSSKGIRKSATPTTFQLNLKQRQSSQGRKRDYSNDYINEENFASIPELEIKQNKKVDFSKNQVFVDHQIDPSEFKTFKENFHNLFKQRLFFQPDDEVIIWFLKHFNYNIKQCLQEFVLRPLPYVFMIQGYLLSLDIGTRTRNVF